VQQAVRTFEERPLTDHCAIRTNALRFSVERFEKEFVGYVNNCRKEFNNA
jgi:hypothetical protein